MSASSARQVRSKTGSYDSPVLILDFALGIVDGVRQLSDGFLNVIVITILELLTEGDEPLLEREV